MGLFTSRKGQEPSAADRAGAAVVDPVQSARAQARRRLIGAAVLLGIGVIAFPLLFETQPRPLPVDIPIDIPRKENAPSLPLPPPRTASATAPTPRISSGGVTTERPAAEPPRDVAPAPAATAKKDDTAPAAPKTSQTAPSVATKPSPAPKTVDAAPRSAAAPAPTKASASSATDEDEGARAKALLEGKSVEPRAAAKAADTVVAAAPSKPAPEDKPEAATGRFVVQVAAYGDVGAARDMRQRVEKLGLKSYTQVVEIDGAKRIRVRVGPFSARDDADKAAATLKAAGLPAAVLSL